MEMVGGVLNGLLGLVSLICWIMVLVKMFQAGKTGPAIASIVLIICGIGPLIALIYGWMHADELKVRQLVTVWTICLVAGLIIGGGVAVLSNQVGV